MVYILAGIPNSEWTEERAPHGVTTASRHGLPTVLYVGCPNPNPNPRKTKNIVSLLIPQDACGFVILF
jgi:hypothetical protein